jgi:hypothetical protein
VLLLLLLRMWRLPGALVGGLIRRQADARHGAVPGGAPLIGAAPVAVHARARDLVVAHELLALPMPGRLCAQGTPNKERYVSIQAAKREHSRM